MRTVVTKKKVILAKYGGQKNSIQYAESTLLNLLVCQVITVAA